ncbi:MAG: phosphoribosylglycinamide synthetase C domain-containing protein, partial [Planctomycetota bacterium]
TGYEITGIEEAEAAGAVVFHAGTALKDGKLVTAGGRVLGVTAQGETLKRARENAYAAVRKIQFKAAHYRTDIAAKGLAALGENA